MNSPCPRGGERLRLFEDQPHGGVLHVGRVAMLAENSLDHHSDARAGVLAVLPIHARIGFHLGVMASVECDT